MGSSVENVGTQRNETDTVILRDQDLMLCRRRLTQTDADLRPSTFTGCRCPHSTVVAGALRRDAPEERRDPGKRSQSRLRWDDV